MAKRKTIPEVKADNSSSSESSSEESSSEDETNIVDIEFEWFDLEPKYDFHGLKTLLRQLLDVDAQLFDLSALTDLILSPPGLGSTVKVEGKESDPYAFLTVLNLHEHKDKVVIQDIVNYVKTQSSHVQSLSQLDGHIAPKSTSRVGLILTERLLNMPLEVAPPLYKLLLKELSRAIEEEEERYDFTHYLILSKTYREVSSALDEEEAPKSKKQRKAGKAASEMFYFHPEDEVLQKHATAYGSFEYQKESTGSDAKRTFQELGIKPEGYLMLIEATKLQGAVQALQGFFEQG
ncbi:Mss4p nuclear export [Lecanora helva]